eukprot:gnl/Dysnectes_brevis/7855_a13576_251.p1 GENE.gnl/Dysnectes_brevis/7855_a13576_251~~gnl/Dysnectes_brevis/7855_a13576_251.p1  ORF type:complete len:304 (+),score=-10.35 gnl/Dysnectes_brevis/7855_a13576_251:166-1077(+)
MITTMIQKGRMIEAGNQPNQIPFLIAYLVIQVVLLTYTSISLRLYCIRVKKHMHQWQVRWYYICIIMNLCIFISFSTFTLLTRPSGTFFDILVFVWLFCGGLFGTTVPSVFILAIFAQTIACIIAPHKQSSYLKFTLISGFIYAFLASLFMVFTELVVINDNLSAHTVIVAHLCEAVVIFLPHLTSILLLLYLIYASNKMHRRSESVTLLPPSKGGNAIAKKLWYVTLCRLGAFLVELVWTAVLIRSIYAHPEWEADWPPSVWFAEYVTGSLTVILNCCIFVPKKRIVRKAVLKHSLLSSSSV